ncbi:MAG: hypothetical protein L0K86_11860 [Actinomycetia bacterium]|nr:hypothetical protein [Actinomycetes bacterium]
MTDPVQRAIDGLVAVCTGGAWALAYVWEGQTRQLEVVDGPLLAGTDQPRVLAVGSAAQFVSGAGRGQERPGFGGRVEHQVDVSCQLEVWSGDTSMAAARAGAAETLGAFRRLLVAHPDLDGAVGWARLVGSVYRPLQTEQGAAVQIDLVVRVAVTTFDD